MRLNKIIILWLPFMFLSACTIIHSRYRLADEATGTDILTGEWRDRAGMLSSFDNGKFETRTPDTDEKLAEGNYRIEENNTVNIEVKSLVKGTVSNVNCSLSHFNHTLYCSPLSETADGVSFRLFRVN